MATRDGEGVEGPRSAEVRATTTGAAPKCRTANNHEHVQAGRATTTGGYVYALGSRQNMGLYDTFVVHTLKESPAGYHVIADGSCP